MDGSVLLTIVLMALVTYSTRLGGFLLLRNRTLSPRALKVLDTAPGCVLIAVIAPHFVSSNPADLIALVVALIAATRLAMLPTVLLAVGTCGLMRAILQ